MTAHTAAQQRQAIAQAAQIHDMAARHVPDADIAAACGCTIARVRAVLTEAAPDPTELPQARPTVGPHPMTMPARTMTVPALLDACTGHDDARVARFADHITSDLDTLRALLAAEQERAAHADRIRAINTRLANLHTGNAARHRRRSDGISA